VAARLQVSQRAVEMHLSSVYQKLGVRTRTDLAVLASTRGLEAECADIRLA
jgi:DNA-binding NarL/FixJ family response regulator